MNTKRFASAAACVLLFLTTSFRAFASDSIETDYDFAKKYAVSSAVAPVKIDELTGEQVSQFDGTLSFQVVDVAVPGNSALRVEVGRTWTRDLDAKVQVKAFQDWDLDVPSISGTFSKAHGWRLPKVGSTSPLRMDGAQYVPDAFYAETAAALTARRCSAARDFHLPVKGNYQAVMPPTFSVRYANRPATPQTQPKEYWQQIDPSEYWSGYHINVPGEGKQQLLIAASENNNRPSDAYSWVTAAGWVFSCISSDDGGEGFLALSPQGVKYYFDHLVYLPYWRTEARAPNIAADCYYGCNANTEIPDDYSSRVGPMTSAAVMERVEARLYATKVEDRFGNWVQYGWTGGKLNYIRANDGREVKIFYGALGAVERVVNGDKTWTYTYAEKPVHRPWNNKNFLTAVTLPDGSAWRYGLDELSEGTIHLKKNDYSTARPPANCQPYGWDLPLHPTIGREGERAYVKAPSGVEVRYLLQPRRHPAEGVKASGFYPHHPDCFRLGPPPYYDELSLVQKEVVGTQLSYKWTYDYAKVNSCSGSVCIPAYQVSTTEPDGSVVRNVFGVRAPQDMRWLLSTEWVAGGIVKKRVEFTNSLQASSYPARIGYSPLKQADLSMGFDEFINYQYVIDPEASLVGKSHPAMKRVTVQDGVTFTWSVSAFDGFARPVKIVKASSIGYSQEEHVAYHDDIPRWVIGQLASRHVNNIEVSRTEFDVATVLPQKTFVFGRLAQSLAYYPDGTVKAVSDGNDSRTVFANWKRGIPQSIQYADSTGKSAVVDNDGFVRSVTDESGATTRYDYDLLGRLKLIDYPDGDSVNWANTVVDFRQVQSDEYGIGPGHWRQTITTGNQRKSIYLDGLWRPLVEREEDISDPSTVRVSARKFDHEGRVISAFYPQGLSFSRYDQFAQGVHTIYDALGRVARTVQDSEHGALVTKVDYLSGFRRQTTNPRNSVTLESFQVFDTPSYDHPVRIESPEGAVTTIPRDAFGKPVEMARGAR